MVPVLTGHSGAKRGESALGGMLLWLPSAWGNLSPGGGWPVIMVGMGELNLRTIFSDGVVFLFYSDWFHLIDFLTGGCAAFAPGRRVSVLAISH